MYTGSYIANKTWRQKKNVWNEGISNTGYLAPFTRSATEQLIKGSLLHLSKGWWPESVQVTNWKCWASQNSAISPRDAHAIAVRYHKVCWTQHVFHVLRDDACNQTKPTKTYIPMQIPCLIELINLHHFQHQRRRKTEQIICSLLAWSIWRRYS